MRATVSILLLLSGALPLRAQTLAEMARQERERRKALQEQQVRSFANYGIGAGVIAERKTARSKPVAKPPASPAPQEATAAKQDGGSSERPAAASMNELRAALRSPSSGKIQSPSPAPASGEAQAQVQALAQSLSGQGGAPPASQAPAIALPSPRPEGAARRSGTATEGAVYLDWFGARYSGGISTSQLSSRVRLETGSNLGEGWRAYLDLRDRWNRGSRTSNQVILYDARLVYDRFDHPFKLSIGQMNLYDSAGAGQLLGGLAGVQVSPGVSVGGYAGLEPEIYAVRLDSSYQKFGWFTRYDGENARSASLSYNALRYLGRTERAFLYSSSLMPLGPITLYGNVEYELTSFTASRDRLSRLFMNARYTFSEAADLTAYYSTGKGLDYHRFLIEQSQEPTARRDAELERFYYTRQLGARFSVKPHRQVRLYVAQQRSEQRDRFITNHTTQLGGSAWNLGGSGVSVYGNYNINRGDSAESDMYSLSVSRDVGPASWTAYYSNTFRAVRFDSRTGVPQLVRIVDRRTVSNDLFFRVTAGLGISVEHEYSSQGDDRENTLFLRAIYRF